MSIRTYLILTYLGLILALVLGMMVLVDRGLDRITARNLALAEESALAVATANFREAKEVLTTLGENSVKEKAEMVARELSFFLSGRKNYDYARLRHDPLLRRVAIQQINAPDGPAGYTDVYDRKGEVLFHPDPAVEGQKHGDWREEYPENWALGQRSLTEDRVSGYYSFFDKNKRIRRRYSMRVHVPGTPFIVGAIVNIDEFFLPAFDRMKKAGQETLARARGEIERHAAAMDRQIKLTGGLVGVMLALLGVGFALIFATAISRPISRLRDGVRQVGEGDFSVAVPARGAREVVQLAHSFNDLGRQLTEYMEKRDFIRDTFSRYVTQEVVHKLLESREALELGGETREVSLLISDIRGFTALTADMAPEQIITFLNRYLGRMIEILTNYGAVIDEIMGDGILAFFGAPEPQADHPVRAVACALQMQAAMDEINVLNEAEGLPHLEMGLAVNTGEAVVGNIGSERRAKYSVVGSQVNFTSRIEASALGGQVLISAATYARVQDLVTLGDTLRVEMKGVAHPAILHEVLGIAGPYNLRLQDKKEALVPLREKLAARLYRLREKIITGAPAEVQIAQCSETAAILEMQGDLEPWEDVRLCLLDAHGVELPGKIYAKITEVQPGEGDLRLATLRFTSVAPESLRLIQKAMNFTKVEP